MSGGSGSDASGSEGEEEAAGSEKGDEEEDDDFGSGERQGGCKWDAWGGAGLRTGRRCGISAACCGWSAGVCPADDPIPACVCCACLWPLPSLQMTA
jgi:hypothetical protein